MKNNKLIAEFMGWDVKSLTTIPPNLHLSNLELDNGEVMQLKFHTSWDWLMPVVVKCFDVFGNTDNIDYCKLNDALLTCNIEELYSVVVEFIKEYNKN